MTQNEDSAFEDAGAAPESGERQTAYFYAEEAAESKMDGGNISGDVEDIDTLETANFEAVEPEEGINAMPETDVWSADAVAVALSQADAEQGARDLTAVAESTEAAVAPERDSGSEDVDTTAEESKDCLPDAPETGTEEPGQHDGQDSSQGQEAGEAAAEGGTLSEEELAALEKALEPREPEEEEPAEEPLIGVISAEDETAGKTKRRKRKASHIVLNILAVLVGIVVVAAAGFGAWLYLDNQEHVKLIPAKTMLDSQVDLSGLTHEEAMEIVQKRADLGYSSQVNLKVADKVHVIDLDDVGEVNVKATVDEAFKPYESSSFIDRAYKRVQGFFTDVPEESYEIHTICDVAETKLKKRIKEIAKEEDRDAIDAGYQYAKGKLVTTPAQTGVKVDRSATLKAVQEKLAGSTGSIDVDAVAKITQPQAKEPGQAIYVNTGSCRLYLYEGGKEVIDWPCSPGQSGYATPTGDWYLEYKDAAPTWINPHSDWSKDMPETIEPGPGNPLGLRALAVSCGGGIYIHGTTNTGALGSRDSHGCVRLSNDNIVELYNRVSAGIPIIIR